MTKNVEKTIPSEDVKLAWLAGIIDGEGSVGVYITSQKRAIFNLSIVNSDLDILSKVEEILTDLNIYFSRFHHNYTKRQGFLSHTPCYVLTVRRRDELEILIPKLLPFLIGKKKGKAKKLLEYLQIHPRFVPPIYYCKNCKKSFSGRKRKYCSLKCWHEFACGSNNPHYKSGKYITRND